MNRTRTSGGLEPREVSRYVYVAGTNPPPYPFNPLYAVQTATTKADYRFISDTVTPNYRRLIAQGAVINNPYHTFRVISHPSSDSVSARQVPGSPVTGGYQYVVVEASGDLLPQLLGPLAVYSGAFVFDLYPTPSGMETERAKAINGMLQSISPPSAQSLVTVLESHKTVKQILDRVSKLKDYIHAARTGNVALLNKLIGGKRPAKLPKRYVVWDTNGVPIQHSPKKFERRYGHYSLNGNDSPPLDRPSALWLEYRYGWSPLIYDIVDSLKALYAEDLRNDLIHRDRFTARGRGGLEDFTSTTNSLSANRGDWTWRLVVDQVVSFRAYAFYEHFWPEGILRRLNDFGIFDVPAALWEITPWSFVVDWICPIGDYMAALTPKFGVNVLAAGVTTDRYMNVERKVLSYNPQGAGGSDYWPSPWPCNVGCQDSVTYNSVVRDVGLPTPVFPHASININSKRIADAFALLRGSSSRNLRV